MNSNMIEDWKKSENTDENQTGNELESEEILKIKSDIVEFIDKKDSARYQEVVRKLDYSSDAVSYCISELKQEDVLEVVSK